MYRHTEMRGAHDLRNEYKYLVGWGAGKEEYFMHYNPAMYHLDYMIDINEAYHGKTICGVQISGKQILKELKDQGKICVIIYPNAEYEIIEQISEYLDDFDIIVSRLIESRGGLFRDYILDCQRRRNHVSCYGGNGDSQPLLCRYRRMSSGYSEQYIFILPERDQAGVTG